MRKLFHIILLCFIIIFSLTFTYSYNISKNISLIKIDYKIDYVLLKINLSKNIIFNLYFSDSSLKKEKLYLINYTNKNNLFLIISKKNLDKINFTKQNNILITKKTLGYYGLKNYETIYLYLNNKTIFNSSFKIEKNITKKTIKKIKKPKNRNYKKIKNKCFIYNFILYKNFSNKINLNINLCLGYEIFCHILNKNKVISNNFYIKFGDKNLINKNITKNFNINLKINKSKLNKNKKDYNLKITCKYKKIKNKNFYYDSRIIKIKLNKNFVNLINKSKINLLNKINKTKIITKINKSYNLKKINFTTLKTRNLFSNLTNNKQNEKLINFSNIKRDNISKKKITRIEIKNDYKNIKIFIIISLFFILIIGFKIMF